jgi:hypothetical protein
LFALALVFLWIPATVHCKLEELPGLQFLSCCDHGESVPHQDDDCAVDACATVEGGIFKAANPKVDINAPGTVLVLDCSDFEVSDSDTARFRVRQLSERSPDLPLTWQFTLRTALAPRAPSFVS